MDLKRFISMEKPWEYNFEFECAKIKENFLQNENIFERFFTYKVMNKPISASGEICYPEAEIFFRQVKEDGYSKFDCDNCSLSIRICTALWRDKLGYKKLKYVGAKGESEWTNVGFETDTMNSAIIPWGKLSDTLGDGQKAKPKGYTTSLRYLLQCFLGDNQSDFKAASDVIKNYINSYHMLGNYVLVPSGFNAYRGDNNELNDFWDFSLGELKDRGFTLKKYNFLIKDYENVRDRNGKEVVIFNKNDFENYINYFFLWDYVKITENGYEVNPVGMSKIGGERDLREFFEKTVQIIECRGKFMTAMLMIQNESAEIYLDIQTELQDKILGGIDGAAKHILEKFAVELKNNKLVRAKDILEKLENEVIE